MRVLVAGTLAALVCAGAARAQDRRGERPPPPPQEQEEQPPLSKEDAELVKELALLEKLDLVRNLELFQEDKEGEPKQAERQQ